MPTAVQGKGQAAAAEPARTTGGRLALNAFSNLAINLLTALISIFLTPFILHHMGDQRYGLWAVLGSVYTYSMVLQLGLYSAINRDVPMHLALAQTHQLREVTSTTTVFFLAMSLLLLGLTFAGAEQVLKLFVIPPALHSPARLALYAVGVTAAICLSLNSFSAVLSGYQRYELIALSRLVAIALRVSLVLLLLVRGETLLRIALIFGATECLAAMLNLRFAWGLLPAHPLQWGAVHWPVLRQMLGYGINTFLYSIGAVAVAKTGELVVGAYLPPEHITYYTLALMPPMLLTGFVESAVAALKPAVSDLHSRKELRRIRELTLLAQKYVLLFLLPAMAFLLVLGGSFYQAWLHRPVPEAVRLLPILSAGYLVHAAQFPLFQVLAGRGEHRIFGLLTLAMGAGAVGLEVLFCHGLGWGSTGVALGSALAIVAVCGVALPVHAARRLAIPLSEFSRRSWLPALGASLPAVLALLCWRSWRPPHSLLALAVVAATTGLVLIGSTWVFALDTSERTRLLLSVAGRAAPGGRASPRAP